jgi:hypothetical protein
MSRIFLLEDCLENKFISFRIFLFENVCLYLETCPLDFAQLFRVQQSVVLSMSWIMPMFSTIEMLLLLCCCFSLNLEIATELPLFLSYFYE